MLREGSWKRRWGTSTWEVLQIDDGREGEGKDGGEKRERARASIVCLNASNGAVGPVAAMNGGAYLRMMEASSDHSRYGAWEVHVVEDLLRDSDANESLS